MLSKIFVCLVVCCVYVCRSSDTIQVNQSHTPVTTYLTLYKGHFNHDCLADTLIAETDYRGMYNPRMIVWGQGSNCLDSATGFAAIPDSLKVDTTRIELPYWTDMRYSVSVQNVNPGNDSLPDIILYISGEQTPDLLFRSLVLFGQHGLDTIPNIQIDLIDSGFQTHPFTSLDLYEGQAFTDKQVRDITGENSWHFNTLSVSAMQPDIIVSSGAEAENLHLTLFPNPSSGELTIQTRGTRHGDYLLQVVSVSGALLYTEQLHITHDDTQAVLDLQHLASGYYILRLKGQNSFVLDSPFMIVK